MSQLTKWILFATLLSYVAFAFATDTSNADALMASFRAQVELMKLRNQEEYVNDCPKVRSDHWLKTPYFTCKMFPKESGSWQEYCHRGIFDDYWNANCCWIISAENAFRRSPRFPYWREQLPAC